MANVVRVVFGIFCGAIGYFIFYRLGHIPILGAALGVGCAVIIILVEAMIIRRSARQAVVGFIGLAAGLTVANLLSYVVTLVVRPTMGARILLFVFTNLALGYLGIVLAVRKGVELLSGSAGPQQPRPGTLGNGKILDTSVIIDGRIADVAEAHFLEGPLVIPRFVLQELQHIADSPDDLRRARGRRGLEILKKLQAQKHLKVRIEDVNIAEDEQVDSKIVRLAEQRRASIITTDYNLNKVADLHGVVVLNMNDLAGAVKPVFLPGEELEVRLLKRGKEPGQGVGYLEDGTMVVVDEGSTKLGRTVVSIVTSVLQTTAGRMIFAKLKK